MRIALVGHGKMGRMVEELAQSAGVTIAARFDSKHPLNNGDFRVAIDFSTPSAVLENVQRASAFGVNLVVGTTGWERDMASVRRIVEGCGMGVVYGSNFSIGVNMFFHIAREVAEIMVTRPEYDPYIWEMHHRHKKDAPSGTALTLKALVGEVYDREIATSSTRAGEVPGTHTLGFDSEADSITLTHTARSRKGFALGALVAAKWIEGRSGLHKFEEVLWEPQH